MARDIRLKELPSKEVYIDINDLIIYLLLKLDNAQNDAQKKTYRELADKLSILRDKAHKGVGTNV